MEATVSPINLEKSDHMTKLKRICFLDGTGGIILPPSLHKSHNRKRGKLKRGKSGTQTGSVNFEHWQELRQIF